MAGIQNLTYFPPIINNSTMVGDSVIEDRSIISLEADKITAGTIAAGVIFVGTLDGVSGTFGTITAGTISGVSISGSTITGSTIETAASGQSIVISGSANSIEAYNSSNNVVWAVVSNSLYPTQIMTINIVDDDVEGLVIQNSASTNSTMRLVEILQTLSTNNSSALYVETTGGGRAIHGFNNGNGGIVGFFETGTSGTVTGIQINQNTTGTALVINTSTASNYAASITSVATGAGLFINTTSSTATPILVQGSLVSTHFQKIISAYGVLGTVWGSDGTTPSGNLSGTIGDLCLGGPGGIPYYCTGGTSWTQL